MNKSIPQSVTRPLDYDSFGMITFGRSWEAESEYRYGFAGKEDDDKILGNDNTLDFGARIYNSRLGRWLSVDPQEISYPFISTYNYCLNNPIYVTDFTGEGPDDKEKVTAYKNTEILTIETNLNKAKDAFNKTRNEYIEYYKSIGKISDNATESEINSAFSEANQTELSRLQGLIEKNASLLKDAKAMETQWNKLDRIIEDVVYDFNTKNGLVGENRLDPNLVKAVMFTETEMGTGAIYKELLISLPKTQPEAVYQLNLGRVDFDNINAVIDLYSSDFSGYNFNTNYKDVGNKYDVMLCAGTLILKYSYAKQVNSAHFKTGQLWYNAVVAYKGASQKGSDNANKVWDLYKYGINPYNKGKKVF